MVRESMLSILLVSFCDTIHIFLKRTFRLTSGVLSGLFSASSTPDFTIREIVRCLRLAKDGIDAVILVFSVRNRLTEEEQLTLRTLKILFGSQIVDYMTVVFTNGDAFDDGDTLDDYLEDCPEFQVG